MSLNVYRLLNLVAGPLAFGGILCFWRPEAMTSAQVAALGILAWMAIWWIFEAVPIYVTALLPIPLVPLLTAIPLKDVTTCYGDPIIFLFLGGFLIALGIENAGLHRWLSVRMMSAFGPQPRNQLLAIMCSTFFLSMWVSNTATTLMMFPLVLATVDSLKLSSRSQGIFVLALAYTATLGGISTLVGTVPNMIFAKFSSQIVGVPMPFATWMLIGTPIAVILGVILAGYFCLLLKEKSTSAFMPKESLKHFGPKQIIVLVIFGLTVVNWIFKLDISLGGVTLPGITTLLGLQEPLNDAVIAMIGALLMFIIPTSKACRETVIQWSDTTRIPWGVLLLFGGGIALSMTIEKTGLMEILGKTFELFSWASPEMMVLIVCLVMTFLTEVTSNTAVTQVSLPILFAGATYLNIPPLLLLIPATVSASCAFMLPVATPPNSIVFASGKISIKTMAKTGLILNLIGAMVITVYVLVHPLMKTLN